MGLNRTILREKVMIILYQISFYEMSKLDYKIEDVIKENLDSESDYVNSVVYGVVEKQEELDNTINKYMVNWTIDRLGKTDKAILRLSTYELLYFDTPNIVAINEGIELAKKYSDEKIVSMINGILDSILNNEVKDE